MAGTYTFRLRVWDAAGAVSAVPGQVVVNVCPCNTGLHIELLWSTPGDDDPFDEGPEAGADLDLHVAHPDAAAPDTDGWGPENLNLGTPPGTVEAPLTYRIGVHCWDDHGFGPSQATVRVYLYGSLLFEAANVELANHDLWEVATLEWPSAKVLPLEAPGGGPVIKPAYQPAAFLTP